MVAPLRFFAVGLNYFGVLGVFLGEYALMLNEFLRLRIK